MGPILVIAEVLDSSVRKASLVALGCATRVAQEAGTHFDVLCIGEGASQAAAELGSFGAKRVFVTEIPGGYVCERYLPTVTHLVEQEGHKFVLATATTYGKDLLSRCAAKLKAGLASDVTDVRLSNGSLTFERPMYAGNVFGTLTLNTEVNVATLRQSEFSEAVPQGTTSEQVELPMQAAPLADRVHFLGLEQVASDRPELTDADVVIAGGRALKSSENFKNILEPLADLLGGAIGASRAACDAGYATVDMQVGQTGKVVAPKLYVAVGISGAIQHLAGMKGSKVIVAVNKDKEAPIVQVADYVLAEDLFSAIPALTDALKSAS